MDKMDDTTKAELEKKFMEAVARIDAEGIRNQIAAFKEIGEDCAHIIEPPYEDKISLYYGDDIASALDNWDMLPGAGRLMRGNPYAIRNKARVLVRADWAAETLAWPDGDGVEELSIVLEDIVEMTMTM
ncbi:MAG: hypothetical protein LBC63_09030 [Holophagales bacterium]|jgi:hypothetical protein|nr:hypothetical protein [Holophagales bacterium]